MVCINIKLIEPTKINFILLSVSLLTFFKTEKIKVKNKIKIKMIAITPNSSEITEII